MMRKMLLAALLASAIAVPAAARDRMGYQAIAAGDLVAAERTLVAERRIFPGRPELMLNLATVYARTGRVAEARALYDAALAAPDVALELPGDTTASSHALARAGQAQLTPNQVAVR